MPNNHQYHQIRTISDLKQHKFNDEGFVTITSSEQGDVEDAVYCKFVDANLRLKINPQVPQLIRDRHEHYLIDCLVYLSSGYQSLDASRTWLCYWILHSLSLLQVKLDDGIKSHVVQFLGKCQSAGGGFGGAPGLLPHLAATYAAVNALVILATDEAYAIINRGTLRAFLMRQRQPDGSFSMHRGGEIDIRGVYCALSAASLTNVLDEALVEGTADWIIRCQSYEGGFSGCPGMEAHGGYAFCGLASLVILRKGHLCDLQALLRWTVNRQMKLEGGFQGRTNKLVDSCYSFWQGAGLPLIYSLMSQDANVPRLTAHLFDNRSLQEYILVCCQHSHGGLLDKPGKPRDIYHTCYALSGLTIGQHFNQHDVTTSIVGGQENELALTHPVYNIRPDLLRKASIYFNCLEVPQQQTTMDNQDNNCVFI